MLKRWASSFISFYQRGISPLKPACCRFHPTCSEFAKISFRRFGVFKGGVITLRRLLRCHPFHPGGYDPVPYQAVVKR